MTKENELIPHTFDSGITVNLRRVSPLLAMEVKKMFPEPQPPQQEVDYGDGVKKMEQNKAHPDYQAALAQYQQDLEAKIRRMMIKLGVVVNWDEESKKRLADMRAFWQEEYGQDLPEKDDTVAFVSFVAIGSDLDIEDLINRLMTRSRPTEPAIADAQAGFRR